MGLEELLREMSAGSPAPTSGASFPAALLFLPTVLTRRGFSRYSSSLERLTSRTLSPAPETLPRKFSRTHGTSVLPTHSHVARWENAPRLPRHPELPPLNSSSPSGPRLEEYLEKPRLVSTVGRKSSAAGNDAPDPLSQQLARLSNYYNQTFLDSYSTYDSMSHKNPVGVLSNNRGMWTFEQLRDN